MHLMPTVPLPLARLWRDGAAVAATEFALILPVFLGGALWGIETANYAVVTMQVSQIASHLADDASRIGDTSTLEDRKIYESDINDLFDGANVQAGKRLDFFTHGRAIISSLEVVPDSTSRQYIHWQRCRGEKPWTSSYGEEGDGLDGAMSGMGPASAQVAANPDEAVIFVEVAYDYQPLIAAQFIGHRTIKAISSFTVRDDRDLSQIYQRDAGRPDPVADCSTTSGSTLAGTAG